MNQLHTLDAKDLQSLEAVSKPLNEGIVSLYKICMSLKDAHVDHLTDTCSNYKQIREHIERADEYLKISEQKIKEKLTYLDESMEKLTRMKENYAQQKKEKQLAMDKLKIEMNSEQVLLNNSKAALEQAEKNLESAKHALRVQQQRRDTGEGVAIAGGVLLAIPIIGWIAGPVMLSEGLQQLNEASDAVRAAEKEHLEYRFEMIIYGAKISKYQQQITRSHNEIEQTSDKLKSIEWEIEEVQNHLSFTADFQEMVRRAVNLLSVLSGRVCVLENQTRLFIHWNSVVKAMEDVMKAVVNIAENRLFYSQGVPGFIRALKEKAGELLALCNSPITSDKHEDYY